MNLPRFLAPLATLALAGCTLTRPANLTVEAESAWKVGGGIEYVTRNGTYSGPLGRVAVVMDVPVTRTLELSYGVEHRSAIFDSADRGSEYAVARMKWRPFAGSGPR